MRVLVATTPEERERVRGVLSSLGAGESWSRPQAAHRVVVTATFITDESARLATQALRAAGLMAITGPATPGHSVAWGNRTAPIWFGDGACVCQPWAEFDRTSASLVVEIDPGRGFGSGAHPTTRMVLDEIAARVRPDTTVLDVGCGTGVLAIAAARLGSAAVVAVDIDDAAVEVTRANASLNGVAGAVRASSEPLPAIDGPFELIVANISASTLVLLAPELRRLSAPNGRIVLSGLSPGQSSIVSAAMRPLDVVSSLCRDDWVALVLEPVRRASS
jgi:ribosomal protein L11 methyltransferase